MAKYRLIKSYPNYSPCVDGIIMTFTDLVDEGVDPTEWPEFWEEVQATYRTTDDAEIHPGKTYFHVSSEDYKITTHLRGQNDYDEYDDYDHYLFLTYSEARRFAMERMPLFSLRQVMDLVAEPLHLENRLYAYADQTIPNEPPF